MEHQPDSSQRGGAEQRLIALLAKDHGRGAALAVQLEVSVPHLARGGRSVGQRKINLPVGANSQFLEGRAGHKAVNGAGVYQKADGRFAPGTAAFLHEQGLVCQAHSKAKLAIFFHRDNVKPITPTTAMIPPTSEWTVGRSPSRTIANGITTMGVMAVMASTMPVGVVSSAHCRQLTPSV